MSVTREDIDRREAIRRVTALLGGVALVGGSTLVTACERAQRGAAAGRGGAGTFTAQDIALLDEVADTILPETKTPGAKAAHVGAFMAATPAQRLALLEKLDHEQKAYMDTRKGDAPPHYFRLMKELTLLGYFTSEIGCTQAQRYVEAPGRYDPCVPYTPGDKAWAQHA